jgi:hypothetical protein
MKQFAIAVSGGHIFAYFTVIKQFDSADGQNYPVCFHLMDKTIQLVKS